MKNGYLGIMDILGDQFYISLMSDDYGKDCIKLLTLRSPEYDASKETTTGKIDYMYNMLRTACVLFFGKPDDEVITANTNESMHDLNYVFPRYGILLTDDFVNLDGDGTIVSFWRDDPKVTLSGNKEGNTIVLYLHISYE